MYKPTPFGPPAYELLKPSTRGSKFDEYSQRRGRRPAGWGTNGYVYRVIVGNYRKNQASENVSGRDSLELARRGPSRGRRRPLWSSALREVRVRHLARMCSTG